MQRPEAHQRAAERLEEPINEANVHCCARFEFPEEQRTHRSAGGGAAAAKRSRNVSLLTTTSGVTAIFLWVHKQPGTLGCDYFGHRLFCLAMSRGGFVPSHKLKSLANPLKTRQTPKPSGFIWKRRLARPQSFRSSKDFSRTLKNQLDFSRFNSKKRPFFWIMELELQELALVQALSGPFGWLIAHFSSVQGSLDRRGRRENNPLPGLNLEQDQTHWLRRSLIPKSSFCCAEIHMWLPNAHLEKEANELQPSPRKLAD